MDELISNFIENDRLRYR